MNKLTLSMLVICTHFSFFSHAAELHTQCSPQTQDTVIALTESTHINLNQIARMASCGFAFTKVFYTIKELITDETGGRIYTYHTLIPNLIINDYTDAISWSIIGSIALYKIMCAERISPFYHKE